MSFGPYLCVGGPKDGMFHETDSAVESFTISVRPDSVMAGHTLDLMKRERYYLENMVDFNRRRSSDDLKKTRAVYSIWLHESVPRPIMALLGRYSPKSNVPQRIRRRLELGAEQFSDDSGKSTFMGIPLERFDADDLRKMVCYLATRLGEQTWIDAQC